MDVVLPVSIGHVTQEKQYYCGPAVLQMTLPALGVAAPTLPSGTTWQDQLYADVKAHTHGTRPGGAPSTPSAPAFPTQECESCGPSVGWRCWATTPDSLAAVDNLRQAVATYSVGVHDDEAATMMTLLDTVDRGLPAQPLIYGWNHWVVMDGYRHSDPGASPVAGRMLNGVYIRDSSSTASSFDYVAWPTFRDQYLLFVGCGVYLNTIVALGAATGAAPPSSPPSSRSSSPSPPPDRDRWRRKRFRFDGPRRVRMMSPAQARDAAMQSANDLRASRRWSVALERAEAGDPLLVQRLDRNDEYYYVAPFRRGYSVTARLSLDAHSAEFQAGSGVDTDNGSLPKWIDPRQVIASQEGRAFDLPTVRPFLVRPASVGLHPVLVWRPCTQSSSPLMPFYQLTVGDCIIYLRVDGQVFARLTDEPA